MTATILPFPHYCELCDRRPCKCHEQLAECKFCGQYVPESETTEVEYIAPFEGSCVYTICSKCDGYKLGCDGMVGYWKRGQRKDDVK